MVISHTCQTFAYGNVPGIRKPVSTMGVMLFSSVPWNARIAWEYSSPRYFFISSWALLATTWIMTIVEATIFFFNFRFNKIYGILCAESKTYLKFLTSLGLTTYSTFLTWNLCGNEAITGVSATQQKLQQKQMYTLHQTGDLLQYTSTHVESLTLSSCRHSEDDKTATRLIWSGFAPQSLRHSCAQASD